MTDLTRGGFRFGPARPWSRDFFRIVSWNIERGLQFPKILDFLRTIEADLLLLQEVDLNARRTRYRDIASELAHALNLNYVFGMEFQELSEGTAASPAFHGNGDALSMAALESQDHSFPRPVHVLEAALVCARAGCFSAPDRREDRSRSGSNYLRPQGRDLQPSPGEQRQRRASCSGS